MTRQIAVRLPDDIVDFIDQAVADGRARSRAAVVSKAVERERRRQVAARDVEILTGSAPDDDDLDGLARYAGKVPLELD